VTTGAVAVVVTTDAAGSHCLNKSIQSRWVIHPAAFLFFPYLLV